MGWIYLLNLTDDTYKYYPFEFSKMWSLMSKSISEKILTLIQMKPTTLKANMVH